MTKTAVPPSLDDIILEFTVVGGILRVTAMDTASLTEVVVQGPIGTDRTNLANLARQKLAFVLQRTGGGSTITAPGGRRTRRQTP